jgi:hypothetical protein
MSGRTFFSRLQRVAHMSQLLLLLLLLLCDA